MALEAEDMFSEIDEPYAKAEAMCEACPSIVLGCDTAGIASGTFLFCHRSRARLPLTTSDPGDVGVCKTTIAVISP